MSNYDIANIENRAKYIEEKAKQLSSINEIKLNNFAEEYYFITLRELLRSYVHKLIDKQYLLAEQKKLKSTYQKYALWASIYEDTHKMKLQLGQIAKEVYTHKECKTCLEMLRIFDKIYNPISTAE